MRVAPVSSSIPKPMPPVAGKLVLQHQLERLKKNRAMATLLVHPNDHPKDSSLIATDANSCPKRMNAAGAGIHVLSLRLLDSLTTPEKLDLDRDLLKPLISTNLV